MHRTEPDAEDEVPHQVLATVGETQVMVVVQQETPLVDHRAKADLGQARDHRKEVKNPATKKKTKKRKRERIRKVRGRKSRKGRTLVQHQDALVAACVMH